MAMPHEPAIPNLTMVDTHAHIHFDAFAGEVDAVLHRAEEAGVTRMITVGVNTADSRKAVEMAAVYEPVWAAVGIHPHDAGEAEQGISYVRDLAKRRKVVAVGECGLDFFRSETSPAQQETALRLQIELALELDLPLIFHVREAFDQFFAIVDDYKGVRGVVHCFTAGPKELRAALDHDLYVAINGIATFAKSDELEQAIQQIPTDRLLLETDCPFLSPVPFRGKTNEPARIGDIAAFVSQARDEPVQALAAATTENASRLFNF